MNEHTDVCKKRHLLWTFGLKYFTFSFFEVVRWIVWFRCSFAPLFFSQNLSQRRMVNMVNLNMTWECVDSSPSIAEGGMHATRPHPSWNLPRSPMASWRFEKLTRWRWEVTKRVMISGHLYFLLSFYLKQFLSTSVVCLNRLGRYSDSSMMLLCIILL